MCNFTYLPLLGEIKILSACQWATKGSRLPMCKAYNDGSLVEPSKRCMATTLFSFTVGLMLVEIGPEGGCRHNSPRNASLPSLLSRSCFHYSRRGKEMRKYLTQQEMPQGDTWQTEDRKTSSSLRRSLLITVCPFHYKGFTIYRSPLGMVICLNYTFFVPDKRL
jgi:hypothetical protein